MERRRRRRPALALALALVACCWSVVGAVDVGDTGAQCANVTTVSVSKRSNSTSSSKAAASVQILTTDCEDDTIVKVKTTDDGVAVLDLRRQGILVVESLPAADLVQLDNNLVQSFATANKLTALSMANNSIASLASFSLPKSLRSLDLSGNDLGSIDDAKFPSGLQYLNLSGNPIGSIQNADLPSDLLELNIAEARLASLENFAFPSSVTKLNMSSNPITRIAGVIFPADLAELTILAVSASASTTISANSALTLYDSRVLTSVLQEFEVRMTDATLFESLALFDVSTTSTLECSDALASPYYVDDTMLCVLSDSDFAAKYAEVVKSALSGAFDSSDYGSGSTDGSVEMVLPTLTETMEQTRSWFLIVAAAGLTAFAVLFCISGCCRLLGRRATRLMDPGKAKAAADFSSTTGSAQLWHTQRGNDGGDEADVETQRLLDRMMTASPRRLDASPVIASPLDYVDRNLKEFEIAGSKLTEMEPMGDVEGCLEGDEGSTSTFAYAVAVYRHRRIALKRLFIRPTSSNIKEEEEAAAQDAEASTNGVSVTGTTLSAFAQEIYLSSTLSHPNLIDFVGYLIERPRGANASPRSISLAMQYMDRGNLNDLIQSRKLALEAGSSKNTTIRMPTAFDHQDIAAKAVTWEDTAADENSLGTKWSWYNSSPALKSKLAIAIDVARALEYMHSLSPTLFHGNLSSRKIFFNKQWDVKLGDFTSSSALRRWSAAAIGTNSSVDSEGSTAENDTVIHLDMTVWSAPEVVDGRQYTERSDIYSFGILLAQLDTYEYPSDMQSMMDDADVPLLFSNPRHNQQDSSVDGDAPSLVNLLMMQCRAFQPEDRPSASEALQRLLRIEEEIGTVSSSSITSFY